MTIFCPAGVIPERGADSHLFIYQPHGYIGIDIYGAIILANGNIVCLYYNVIANKGPGDGYDNGTDASMIASHSGIIRSTDMIGGSIDHAMSVTVPASILTYEALYPAYAFDRDTVYNGLIPMGSRLALPPTIEVAKIGLTTDQGKIIASAAQQYGLIISDSNSGGIVIRAESGITDPGLASYNGPINSDLELITSMLDFVQVPQNTFMTSPEIVSQSPPTAISISWKSGYSGGGIPVNTPIGTPVARISPVTPDGARVDCSKLGDPSGVFSLRGHTLFTAGRFLSGVTYYGSIEGKEASRNKFVQLFSATGVA
jgi:hypothetical protein